MDPPICLQLSLTPSFPTRVDQMQERETEGRAKVSVSESCWFFPLFRSAAVNLPPFVAIFRSFFRTKSSKWFQINWYSKGSEKNICIFCTSLFCGRTAKICFSRGKAARTSATKDQFILQLSRVIDDLQRRRDSPCCGLVGLGCGSIIFHLPAANKGRTLHGSATPSFNTGFRFLVRSFSDSNCTWKAFPETTTWKTLRNFCERVRKVLRKFWPCRRVRNYWTSFSSDRCEDLTGQDSPVHFSEQKIYLYPVRICSGTWQCFHLWTVFPEQNSGRKLNLLRDVKYRCSPSRINFSDFPLGTCHVIKIFPPQFSAQIFEPTSFAQIRTVSVVVGCSVSRPSVK